MDLSNVRSRVDDKNNYKRRDSDKKIESRKLNWNAEPKISAKNPQYRKKSASPATNEEGGGEPTKTKVNKNLVANYLMSINSL